ncbi:Fructoselysine-6-P-deglycase FrlB with duplicated sugar isomerase (SIS) domain [Actinomadura meyerae]|uniref:Fructoselysine-6-P-deglycase FrlB with duplicated sugar isomerase (SIS) domain n=1 Tax=Actinomadura meyerae TaxID=240840 RepID=A0A239LSU0_9ACTN|nr:SIS domain-containing protein [Actinomadura meyerae]SNT33747.1 Fructoselysine-6-P-deglycase FrlB with duplicated sugar isomerase (SIS) domain [Actinomadura meyerae]
MAGTRITSEIAAQPECWRRAAGLAAEAGEALPGPGERIAVVGCGTSLYMAQAYAALRERAGHGETDAFAASEMPSGRRYDRVLALTRSGTTTEVLEVLDRLAGTGVPTTAITADPGTPVSASAGRVIALEFADEESVVQTRFATTLLALLRAHLGEDLGAAIADAEAAVAGAVPDLLAAGQITFLGRGWTVGIAREAALKMREAAGLWTEAYPAMEYRHGPISITGPGRAVWMFGELPDGLAGDITATGGTLRTSAADPMADLIRAQRLAVAMAEAAGLDPERPRHLTRSVVLGADG